MSTNEDKRYPIDFSDQEITDEIANKLDLLAREKRMSIKQTRDFAQITLGQTELQSRSSKRELRASKITSGTAIALSFAAIFISVWVASSSSRSSDEWRTDQMATLGSIKQSLLTIIGKN